jgi:hypothetical protein
MKLGWVYIRLHHSGGLAGAGAFVNQLIKVPLNCTHPGFNQLRKRLVLVCTPRIVQVFPNSVFPGAGMNICDGHICSICLRSGAVRRSLYRLVSSKLRLIGLGS